MLIYKVTNNLNGKMYIGQTRRTLRARKLQHIRDAKKGSKVQFHRALVKYGVDNFTWETLCYTDNKKELNELETYYIEKYDSINKGYNMIDGGDNNIMDVPEVKEKHKLRMQSYETRRKISETMKSKARNGELFSDEHKKNLSIAAIGNHNFGTGDTRSIGCFCITESGDKYEFHSYRDAWDWWKEQSNNFDTKTECVYQRKIKQSIEKGFYTYKKNKFEYPKWYRKDGDVNEKVTN